jgi:hypothetical protein
LTPLSQPKQRWLGTTQWGLFDPCRENGSTVRSMTVKEQGRRDSELGPYEMDPGAIAARFAWARHRGHPFWLWPDVHVADWQRALSSIEMAVAALLAGRSAPRLANQNQADRRALEVAVHTSGTGPWLGWHVEQGALDADASVRLLLLDHLAHSRKRFERLDAIAHEVVGLLSQCAESVVVLKGMSTVLGVFSEPGLRPMADIDVLPYKCDVTECERVLAAHGYLPRSDARHHRPYRSEWLPSRFNGPLRSLTITHAEDPVAVDLHGSLDIDFFGVQTVGFGEPAAELLAAAPAYGQDARILRQPLLGAQLAVHASHGLHSLTLIRLVELTLVLRKDMRSQEDWRALSECLRQHRAERFAYPALTLVEKLAPETVPQSLLQALKRAAPARLQRVVSPLRPATAQRLDQLAIDERFMWAETRLEHVRRFGNMLLPTGATGSLRRLARIYVERAFRLVRLRVSLRGNKT